MPHNPYGTIYQSGNKKAKLFSNLSCKYPLHPISSSPPNNTIMGIKTITFHKLPMILALPNKNGIPNRIAMKIPINRISKIGGLNLKVDFIK